MPLPPNLVGPPPPFLARLRCFVLHRWFWADDFLGTGGTWRCYRCGIAWVK